MFICAESYADCHSKCVVSSPARTDPTLEGSVSSPMGIDPTLEGSVSSPARTDPRSMRSLKRPRSPESMETWHRSHEPMERPQSILAQIESEYNNKGKQLGIIPTNDLLRMMYQSGADLGQCKIYLDKYNVASIIRQCEIFAWYPDLIPEFIRNRQMQQAFLNGYIPAMYEYSSEN
jgi:hypothetical protein